MASNTLQNTLHKTKDWATRTPQKNREWKCLSLTNTAGCLFSSGTPVSFDRIYIQSGAEHS